MFSSYFLLPFSKESQNEIMVFGPGQLLMDVGLHSCLQIE